VTLIGLTGGIASGKSTVARRLAESGAVVVDADQLAREAVAPGSPGLAAVAAEFGPSILAADGALDRPALGAIVFADADARARLNAIVHPEVGRLSRARFGEALAEDPAAVVVYDVPLLAESRGAHEFDRVVVVHAPAEERIRRLVEFRGMAEDEARRRVLAQATDEERLAMADDVIDASGTLGATLEQADALWARLTAAR
jgi:dephospho-CoA kinase